MQNTLDYICISAFSFLRGALIVGFFSNLLFTFMSNSSCLKEIDVAKEKVKAIVGLIFLSLIYTPVYTLGIYMDFFVYMYDLLSFKKYRLQSKIAIIETNDGNIIISEKLIKKINKSDIKRCVKLGYVHMIIKENTTNEDKIRDIVGDDLSDDMIAIIRKIVAPYIEN